jgi:hypothetical protein
MLNIELKNEKQLEQMTDHEIKAYYPHSSQKFSYPLV